MRRRVGGSAAAAAVGLGAATPAAAQDLTIYSSLPLQGSPGAQARAVLLGEQLALEQAGARVGPFGIRL
jgi:hypothetical protein